MKELLLLIYGICFSLGAFAQTEFIPRPDLSDNEIIDAVTKSAPYSLYKKGICLEYARANGDTVVNLFREKVTDVHIQNGLYVVTVQHLWLPSEELRKPANNRKFLPHQSFTTEIDPNGTYHLTHNLQYDSYFVRVKKGRNGYAVLMPHRMQPGDVIQSSSVLDVINAGLGRLKTTATYSNVKVCGNEDVTTPAGTFKCVKITGEFNLEGKWGQKHKVSYKYTWWFAKGLGLVKCEAVDIDSNSWLGPDASTTYLNCINPKY